MVILGLSPIVHESAAGLVVDGKLVAATSEERFTRKKNDGGFPHRSIEFCLRSAGIEASDIDYVAYAALPFSRERARDVVGYVQNVAYVVSADDALSSKLSHLLNYSRNMVWHKEWASWGKTERRIRDELRKLGLADKMVYVDHHRAHVASAVYSSGFDECLGVSLDGYGSGQAGSFYLARGGKLELLASIPYPHSLGTFYRRVTQALGFIPNRHEGKIVGLAAFGDPSRLYDRIFARFDVQGEDHFRFKSGQDPFFDKKIATEYSREDVAAAYQRVLEDVATHYVAKWVRKTGVSKIACAGGVMANVKMNQRLAEIPEVQRLFVFPNMGDGGVGVGAALALYADVRGLDLAPLPHVYLGPSFSDGEISRELSASGLLFSRFGDIESEIVHHLVNDRVVARFDGAMEFGPRALGNRSILYPAKDPKVNTWLNARLKRTEFMPFAPITLADGASELFEGIDRILHAAEFMTVTTNCTAKMKQQSPAAVHVDGTARPQLAKREVNPSITRVLELYRDRTGIPTLINTSYNMHEEPIVCSPHDAVRAFKDSGLEVLAIGNFIATQSTTPHSPA